MNKTHSFLDASLMIDKRHNKSVYEFTVLSLCALFCFTILNLMNWIILSLIHYSSNMDPSSVILFLCRVKRKDYFKNSFIISNVISNVFSDLRQDKVWVGHFFPWWQKMTNLQGGEKDLFFLVEQQSYCPSGLEPMTHTDWYTHHIARSCCLSDRQMKTQQPQ